MNKTDLVLGHLRLLDVEPARAFDLALENEQLERARVGAEDASNCVRLRDVVLQLSVAWVKCGL